MGLLSKIKNLLRGNKGTGSTLVTAEPLQEGHELILEEETPIKDEDIQTTVNTDSLNELVEEGVVENVVYDEN